MIKCESRSTCLTDEEKKTENDYDRCETSDKKGWTVYEMSDLPSNTALRCSKVTRSNSRDLCSKDVLTRCLQRSSKFETRRFHKLRDRS